MNSKKLLTGGTGFIETNLGLELESHDYEIIAADHLNTDRENYIWVGSHRSGIDF